jgi:hypothetical protein
MRAQPPGSSPTHVFKGLHSFAICDCRKSFRYRYDTGDPGMRVASAEVLRDALGPAQLEQGWDISTVPTQSVQRANRNDAVGGSSARRRATR